MDGIAVASGFLLGLQHCLEPDHVAAVTQFASADPRPRRGLVFGLAWGAGHGGAVLILALLAFFFGVRPDARLAQPGELVVGVMLVGLGAWRLWHLFASRHDHLHKHADGRVHSHPHAHGPRHLHTHGSTATGFVHGLAGAVAVLALVPLQASPTLGLGLATAFVAGSLLGMSAFGLAASSLIARTDRWDGGLRLASVVGALAAVVLGAAWIARHA